MRLVSSILSLLLGVLLLPVESQHLVKYSHNYSQYNSSGVTSLACHSQGSTCSACSELGGGCGWCQKTQTCGYQDDCQGEWSSSETSCLYEHLFGVIVILVVMFVVILIILLVFFILLLIDQVVRLLQKKPKGKAQNKKTSKGRGAGLEEACSERCWCSDAYSNLDKCSSIPSKTFRRLSGGKPSQIVSPLPRSVEITKMESRGGTPSSQRSSPTPNLSSQRSSPLPTPSSRRSSPLPRIVELDTPKLLRKDNKIIEKLPDIPLDQESKSSHVFEKENVHQPSPVFKQPRSFTMISKTHSLEHQKEKTHEPLPPPKDRKIFTRQSESPSLQEADSHPPSPLPKQPRNVPKKSHRRQTELHSFHVPVYANAFVKTVSCQVPTETMRWAEKEPKMTTSTSTSSLEEILTSPDSLQSMKFMIEPTETLLDYIKSPENHYSSNNYSDSVSPPHFNIDSKLSEAIRSSMESLSSEPNSRKKCGISSRINSKSTNTDPSSPISSRTIHSNLSSPMSSRRNSVIHSPVISRKTPSPSSPNVLRNNSNPSSPIVSRKPPTPSSPILQKHKCDISSSMVSKSTNTDESSAVNNCDQTSPAPSNNSNIKFSIPLSSRITHNDHPSSSRLASQSQGGSDAFSTMTSTRTNSEFYIPFSSTDTSMPLASPFSSGRNTSMSGQLVFSAGRDGVAVAGGNPGAACQSSILQVDNNQFYLVVQINLQGDKKEQQMESTESIDKLKSDEFDNSTIVLRNDKTFTKNGHFERPHSIYCSKQPKPFVDNRPEVKPRDYKRKLRTLQRLSSLSPRNKSNNIQKIVDSFMKLILLKILFIDIGISLGDSITDFLQGINLLWDYNSSTFHQSTFYYGIAVLSTKWLPSILVMSHCWFSSESHFLSSKGPVKVSIIMFLIILFFPIIPTLLYVKILFSHRKSLEDRKRVQMLEQQAHEMRSITSAVESPIQVIILVWLMLRGILTIPIESSLSFFCVEDDLGRMACLPSIPIASLLFSGLSIIKSVFNLNLYPLFIPLNSGINSMKLCIELFLRFTPFFFVNALFRICSYAFILVYIDYWFTIPGVILFMINYIFYSISFTRFHSSSLLDQPSNRPDVCGVNQSKPSDKTMTKYRKRRSFYQYWQKSDMEQENMFNETRRKNLYDNTKAETVTLRSPSAYHRLYSFVDSIYANVTVTPSYVNEENTSIFLNSVTGMFLPSCHTHLNGSHLSSSSASNPRIGKVVGWQKKIFRKQVIAFNLLLFLIIIVIYFLVTQTSFNYISNILDPLWFHIVIVFLGVMWILTIILTLEPDCVKLMAGIKHCFLRKKSSDSSKWALHQVYVSYTNGRESYSGNEKKQYFIKKAFICVFIFIIIVIPLVLTILLFPKIKSAKPYIFFLKEDHTASFDVNFIILGTFPISQINFAKKLVISGQLDTSCHIDQSKDLSSSIFVVSSTNQTCVNLAKQDDFFDIMSRSFKAVIFLDNTPQSHWRVSSNYNRVQSLRGPVPVLGVRQEDWKRASGQFSHGKTIHIAMGDYSDIDMASTLTCTNSSTIFIGNSFEKKKDKDQDLCSVRDDPTHNPESQKYLLVNGSISEHFCLRSECWDLGQPCAQNFFHNVRQSPLTLQCPNSLNNQLSFQKALDGTTLKPIMISGSTGWSDYCCQQSEFGTSTFLEVLGEGCFTRWRDVVNFRDKCGFTPHVKEECVRGQQKVWRVCNAMDGCVIREYFNTYCGTDTALGLCSRSDTTCY